MSRVTAAPESRSVSRWRRNGKLWPTVPVLWGVAALVATAYGAGWLTIGSSADATDAGRGLRARFSMCFTGGGYNCVVDGDTIWLQGVKIRIADIDAPETHDPRCASEKRSRHIGALEGADRAPSDPPCN